MRARGLEVSLLMAVEKSPVQKAGATPTRLREVEGSLVAQPGQIVEDVRLDLLWFGFRVDLLQIADDLLHGVLAVAALDDFEAGAVEAQGAFGHEQDALLIVFAEAAARGQAWAGLQVRRHANLSLSAFCA